MAEQFREPISSILVHGIPTSGEVKLEENFRSSQGIIETAERFIAKVDPEHRLGKEMRHGGVFNNLNRAI